MLCENHTTALLASEPQPGKCCLDILEHSHVLISTLSTYSGTFIVLIHMYDLPASVQAQSVSVQAGLRKVSGLLSLFGGAHSHSVVHLASLPELAGC